MVVITVTMGGIDITSTALDGNTITISKVTGNIVVTAMVIVGYDADLLTTCDVKLNKRWSSSSKDYMDRNGAIAFSVPFKDIDGRTIKITGFTPETDGVSAWYACDANGSTLGRIASTNAGVVWTSSALIDNGDGSYNLPISKEIFFSYSNSKPLTETPTTIYITMYVNGGTAISSTEGLKMLLSDLN